MSHFSPPPPVLSWFVRVLFCIDTKREILFVPIRLNLSRGNVSHWVLGGGGRKLRVRFDDRCLFFLEEARPDAPPDAEKKQCEAADGSILDIACRGAEVGTYIPVAVAPAREGVYEGGGILVMSVYVGFAPRGDHPPSGTKAFAAVLELGARRVLFTVTTLTGKYPVLKCIGFVPTVAIARALALGMVVFFCYGKGRQQKDRRRGHEEVSSCGRRQHCSYSFKIVLKV